MPRLAQVFELASRYGADSVRFDIETKIDASVGDTLDAVEFTQDVSRGGRRVVQIISDDVDLLTLVAKRNGLA
jgi:hypothetical protein